MGEAASRTGEEAVRAVLTVVFTDIEGSTALTERLGDDRWVEVLAAHDAAVRAALASYGGEEVNTTGDGFLAVFGRAADAVHAAVLARGLVGAVRVPEAPNGLRIRVGAHSGPVVRRGGDVLGRNVHLARRITEAARGGEIVVSSAVKPAIRAAIGLRTGPPRTLRLPGVSEPQVVFGIVAGDGDSGAATVHLLDPARRGAGGTARSA